MKYLKFLSCLSLLSTLAACGEEKTETTPPVITEPTKDLVMGVGRVEPEEGIVELMAGTDGRILAVLVDENETVRKGQPLLDIEQAVESSQLAQAQSKLTFQKEAIAVLRSEVEVQRTQLKNAETDYRRVANLLAGNAATQQEVDNKQAEVQRLEKTLAVAQTKLKEGEGQLNVLAADIRYYQTVLSQKAVLSPSDGKVLMLEAKPGQYARADTKVCDFIPKGDPIVRTEVDEVFADRVAVGQKAFICSQTTGDTLANGMVIFAADFLKSKSLFKDQSTELEDRRVREVRIAMQGDKLPLVGSRVDCFIQLK
jgi:multidrug resistance efflux pump